MMLESQITTDEMLDNVHPGEVLKYDFLDEMGISAYKLAKDIGIPQTRISEIIHGRRAITADTAMRLSKYFGTTATYWLNLQNEFDLEEARRQKFLEYQKIQPLA